MSLICVFGSFYNIHHITNSFFNYSTFPTGRGILILFKVNFFSQLEPFLGANVVFRSLFCSESSLSKTGLIFLANIVSAGETASGVLGLGVIMYTCKNCCSALSVGVPDAFLNARFNVSTKRSACRLILGDIMVWLCAAIKRDSVSLLKFHFLSVVCRYFVVDSLTTCSGVSICCCDVSSPVCCAINPFCLLESPFFSSSSSSPVCCGPRKGP